MAPYNINRLKQLAGIDEDYDDVRKASMDNADQYLKTRNASIQQANLAKGTRPQDDPNYKPESASALGQMAQTLDNIHALAIRNGYKITIDNLKILSHIIVNLRHYDEMMSQGIGVKVKRWFAGESSDLNTIRRLAGLNEEDEDNYGERVDDFDMNKDNCTSALSDVHDELLACFTSLHKDVFKRHVASEETTDDVRMAIDKLGRCVEKIETIVQEL